MRKIICLLLLLLAAVVPAMAIMPSSISPRAVVAEKYGQSKTVYVMPLPGLAGDYYPWVAMEPPTSSQDLYQAVHDYCVGQPHPPLYLVEKDQQNRWTWGQYRQPDSLVVASTNVVGFDSPPVNMANQLLPVGAPGQMYQEYQLLQQHFTLDDLRGEVEVELAYVSFQSTPDCPCDTIFAVDGIPQPITRQSDMILSPTYTGATPRGHVPNQTMPAWLGTGLNNIVTIVPGQSRVSGRQYDVPGIVNQVIGGQVQFVRLPYTRCQFDSLYPDIYMSYLAWIEVIAPALVAAGVEDVSIGDPTRLLLVVYLQDWGGEGAMNTARWPHAYLGHGIAFLSLIYEGDITMPAVFFHETCHAIFSWWDHYWPWGDNNEFDPMGWAVYNQGGWVTPYPVASSAHQQHAWPARHIASLADQGTVRLRPFESVYWENPRAPQGIPIAPDSIERIYLTAIPNIGGNTGVGFTGDIRLLVTHTWLGCYST